MIVGVDACKAGWLALADTEHGVDMRVHATFTDLMTAWGQTHRVFIDIPIGLPHTAQPSRACDQLARKALGPRASSVFSPPSRPAAHAGSYDEARVLNIREVGRSLSAQAWGICKKIAEVDAALMANRDWTTRALEVHPEVCFWALAGKRPMAHPKKTPMGHAERMALLLQHEPSAQTLFDTAMQRYMRGAVQPDDVLDAMVALVTGRAVASNLRTLPEPPEYDDQGLPMQMFYREVSPSNVKVA